MQTELEAPLSADLLSEQPRRSCTAAVRDNMLVLI